MLSGMSLTYRQPIRQDKVKIQTKLLPGNNFVIVQGCGQTLGLGLGQSKDIVVVFY